MSGFAILLYHRVGPRDGGSGDAFTVSPETFAEQMKLLRDWGGVGVDLECILSGAASARRPVALTFDDGFASNRKYAWPILADLGFRATTFLVGGRLGGANDWDGPSVPRFPLLSKDDCSSPEASVTSFQSHGMLHKDLTQLDESSLRLELEAPRRVLSELARRPVELFAYPFGRVSAAAAAAARRAGYRAACTCIEGLNRPGSDPFLMRRVAVGEEDLGERFLGLLASGRRPRGRLKNWKMRAAESLLRMRRLAAR